MGESPEVRYSVCLMGQDLRVGRGLFQERLHARGERVVGVVQQDVAVADRREHVGRLRRLGAVGEVAVGARHELGELQLGPVEVGDVAETAQVEGFGEFVDLLLVHAEFAHQQFADLLVDVGGHLEADGRAEPAAQQFLLQRLQQVLGVVLLDLEVLVARHAERVVLDDLHAREQLVEVLGDDVLERDENRPSAGRRPRRARRPRTAAAAGAP